MQAEMYEHNCSYIFYARIYGEHRMDEKNIRPVKSQVPFTLKVDPACEKETDIKRKH